MNYFQFLKKEVIKNKKTREVFFDFPFLFIFYIYAPRRPLGGFSSLTPDLPLGFVLSFVVFLYSVLISSEGAVVGSLVFISSNLL
jgi:hypothetical protein